MGFRKPSKVVVAPTARSSPIARRVLDRYPEGAVSETRIEDPSASGGGAERQKEVLFLTNHQGSFLKPCPGTSRYLCCGYWILNTAMNCPLNCSYCILQSYVNQPYVRIFANLESRLNEVLQTLDSRPGTVFRVGTGEFTDSLALDPLVGWSDLLVPAFSSRKNAVLELKTKTDRTDRLLKLPHRDRIIVSWSLNTEQIIAREERGAASLKARLAAARQCQKEGLVVGFHFDPMIHHRGWRETYLRVVDLLDHYVDPGGVIWISLGSFRFMPRLKQVIRRYHPRSMVLQGEFVSGMDGKMRYFRPIRTEMYAVLRERLEQWHPDGGLYLCMESPKVWSDAMGWSPEPPGDLGRYLDQRVFQIFGDTPGETVLGDSPQEPTGTAGPLHPAGANRHPETGEE